MHVCEEFEASRIQVFLKQTASSHIWLKTKLRIDSEILRIVGESRDASIFFLPRLTFACSRFSDIG